MKFRIIKTTLLLFAFGAISVNAQNSDLCNCWLAEVDREIAKPSTCKATEDLTEEETLEIIESLLNQKGNKKNHIGVVLSNQVSQDCGSSPNEVVALFYASYLFRGTNQFASAMVLLYDHNDLKPNSEKAIKNAHKAYRKWFKKVKTIGLKKAREKKLYPLANSRVSWY